MLHWLVLCFADSISETGLFLREYFIPLDLPENRVFLIGCVSSPTWIENQQIRKHKQLASLYRKGLVLIIGSVKFLLTLSCDVKKLSLVLGHFFIRFSL